MRCAFVFAALLIACAPPGASGLRQDRYGDGKLREEYRLHDGRRHGKAQSWHPTGRTESEGQYVAGRREGLFYFYDEDGKFAYQVMYVRDEEVWRSSDRQAKPDVSAVMAARQKLVKPEPVLEREKPIPWFASLDRTTALTRVGVGLGVGAPAGLGFGAAKRFEAYANIALDDLGFGVYGQLSQTSLQARSLSFPERMYSGRRTLDVGGTRRLPVDLGDTTTARLGMILPLANDTSDGFVAGTTGAFQRPADAAVSVPSTVTLRTSASLTRRHKRFVVQADAGFDWLLGGEPSAFDALGRLNFGVGFGSRTSILTVEVSNTAALSDAERRLHAAGIGGAIQYSGFWLSGILSYCIDGGVAFTTAVGNEM